MEPSTRDDPVVQKSQTCLIPVSIIFMNGGYFELELKHVQYNSYNKIIISIQNMFELFYIFTISYIIPFVFIHSINAFSEKLQLRSAATTTEVKLFYNSSSDGATDRCTMVTWSLLRHWEMMLLE